MWELEIKENTSSINSIDNSCLEISGIVFRMKSMTDWFCEMVPSCNFCEYNAMAFDIDMIIFSLLESVNIICVSLLIYRGFEVILYKEKIYLASDFITKSIYY